MIISVRRFDEDPVTTIKCFSVFLKIEETALLRKVIEKGNISRENYIAGSPLASRDSSYLINLCPQHLLPVIIIRQEELQDVEQAPEGFLLVQEEKGDGGDPIKALAVLDIWVVERVG